MNRRKSICEHFFCFEQMVQIGSGMILTGEAVAVFVDWIFVGFESRICDVDIEF
jgi:hypothetical protein